jgi:hypothetical protein
MTTGYVRRASKKTSDEVKQWLHLPGSLKVNNILQRVYYDPKKGYGGVQALYRQMRKHQIALAQVRE